MCMSVYVYECVCVCLIKIVSEKSYMLQLRYSCKSGHL